MPSILEEIRGMDPYHFEQLIADIWEQCQGWTTEVTQQSRDWGADIIGQPPGHTQQTIVQAKRYNENNPIGSEQIQQYAALRQHHERITGVTVISTGYYTKPARELAEKLDVKIFNGDDLIELIHDYDARWIVDWYLDGKPKEGVVR